MRRLYAFAVWSSGDERVAGVENFQPVAHANGGFTGLAL